MGVLDALDGYKVQVDKELSLAIQARDQAEISRDLLLNYHKKKALEAIAKGSGLYEARKIVSAMLEDLEWLTDWRGENLCPKAKRNVDQRKGRKPLMRRS